MHEAESGHFENQRRRSERVSQSLPVVVRGIDLLGQPFEERTAVLACNLHGCRYSSKHHLPLNAWVTLEIQGRSQLHNVRARVAWSQRPQSVRDFFQVGVELETPANVWEIESPPQDWRLEAVAVSEEYQQQVADRPEVSDSEDFVAHAPFDSSPSQSVESSSGQQSGSGQEHAHAPSEAPGNLNEELRRQAREAVEAAAARLTDDIRASIEEAHQQRLASSEEFFQTWKEEFARVQRGESAVSSEQLSAVQETVLNALKLKFEERFTEARQLLEQLEQKTQNVRSEAEMAGGEQGQIRQEDSNLRVPSAPSAEAEGAPAQAARWNERLELEMALAQSQWNELLQSSLDAGIQRLASELSEHSTDVLRNAEQKLSERFEELRRPLAETATEARGVLTDMRAQLEDEMSHARSSLVDIEQAAGRIKDYSTQLETSSHDTLNELHRRLENILESQTDQLNRHAEQLAGQLTQRLNPTVETLGRELVERTIAEIDAKLTPRLERVPELLRDLSSREIQADESLRLHRERLRQSTESHQRDVAAQMASAVSILRRDFDSASKEAFAKWNEELQASSTRASQAVSEAVAQSAEWFQEETRARLQVLVEQSLATACNNLDGLMSQSAGKYAEDLERQSSSSLAEAQKRIENAASEVAAHSRSQFDEAAYAAAASFGQVLRGISDQEMQQFGVSARGLVQDHSRELELAAQQTLGNLARSAEISLDDFRGRMGSEIETSVSQGRTALAGELNSLLERFAEDRGARETEWAGRLDHLSQEATAKHEDRLQTACDTWIVSSVRRLNEHGQTTVESLMRYTDQALRDSCSKVFENLAQQMRDRNAGAASAGAFVPIPGHDAPESSTAQ